jgi:23S rRNA (uracil1939-C5)-methyltransferase
MGYRHRVRLSVRGRTNSPKIGIFQRDSHRIVDIPDCRVHHPLVNRICSVVKQLVRETGIAPYADRPHRGDLRGIQIVVERDSQTAQLVLIGNADRTEPLQSLILAAERELRDELHSLWWNGNPERTNRILGAQWHHYSGPDAVCETIGGARVYFPPGAFGQSHLALADELVGQVAAWVPDESNILELYAGTGAIGLGLVERSRSVAFNELDASSLAGLERGRAALPGDLADSTQIHAGAATACAELVASADVVIVDPPRKGLEPELRAQLAASPPARFVYASCDIDSFLRDSRELLASNRLELSAAVGYAFLPFTHHLETLACFDRKPG